MRVFLILMVISLAGCTTDRVVVDNKGMDQVMFEKDLAECRVFKQQVPMAKEMARGAAVGAAVGGLVSATAGDSDEVLDGAGVGAVYGAAEKMIDSSGEKADIVKNCLRGRGYAVLN